MSYPPTGTAIIRLVLVDDHAVFRAGLLRLLDGEPDVQFVATATSCGEALQLSPAFAPDVVLVDLHLPDGFGPALIGPLKTLWPECQVIIVTIEEAPLYARASLAAGAVDFIPKRYVGERLLPAIHNAVAPRRSG